jgi:hypothetical protein
MNTTNNVPFSCCPCQDVNVPIAEATPGANKFAVDTASTLQCTFGPGLPNNRLIIRKTPVAIVVSGALSHSLCTLLSLV